MDSKLKPPALTSKPSTTQLSGAPIHGTTFAGESYDDGSLDAAASRSLHHDDDLQNLLSGLIRHNHKPIGHETAAAPSFLDVGMFPGTAGPAGPLSANDNSTLQDTTEIDDDAAQREQKFVKDHIAVEKNITKSQFNAKLKHFLIFSVAGKPIYSLNGQDSLVISYTGLITSIIATFHGILSDEVHLITYSDVRIAMLYRDPLVLVSVSKIGFEMIDLAHGSADDSLLMQQLHVLLRYLYAILSKSVITKYFTNRANFDLRNVLTPLDYSNLDKLCTSLTYASADETDPSASLEFFLGAVFQAFPTTRVTNTLRTKLNSMLMGIKNSKERIEDIKSSKALFKLVDDAPKYLSDDLIFGLLTLDNQKVIGSIKPKNHCISNDDIKLLLFILKNNNNTTDDLWLPICMPDFNPNGFLYVYFKKFDLAKYIIVDGNYSSPEIINIILISGSKNSFYAMQQLANKLVFNVVENETFRNRLNTEIKESKGLKISTIDNQITSIDHFIYKHRETGQFIMNDIDEFDAKDDTNRVFQLAYYYTCLCNSKSNTIKKLTSLNQEKKLTYSKWASAVGFMLSDDHSEFYCLSSQKDVALKNLIEDALLIIKWCEKNHKRLFNKGLSYSF